MTLRLVHNILIFISVHSLLTEAHVLRADAEVPKVVSGPGRIVSVSKPINAASSAASSRDDESKEVNNLLYAIYHKYYKNDQQQKQHHDAKESVAAQEKKKAEEPTKRAVALKELENTIDKLIASLSDENSASKLQTKDINKGINDISKLANAANIVPAKSGSKDAIAASADNFPQFKRNEQPDNKKRQGLVYHGDAKGATKAATTSSEGNDNRIFHDHKRAAEIENFADFKSRFYRTFLPEFFKNDPGILYPGDQKSKDQGILYHGDQKSSDQGILYHGKDDKSKDQGILYHGKDAKSKVPGILYPGKDAETKVPGILYPGKDAKAKVPGILYPGKDAKAEDQRLLYHGKDQRLLYHGKDSKPKDQGILYHGKDTAASVGGSQINDLIRLYELLKKQTRDEEKAKKLAVKQSQMKETTKKSAETIAVLPDVRKHDSHMDTLKKDLARVFDDLQKVRTVPPSNGAIVQHRDVISQHNAGSQHDVVNQPDVVSKHDAVTHHDNVADEKETKRRLLTLMHSLEAQLTADNVREQEKNVADKSKNMEQELDNLTTGQHRTQSEREKLFREALKGFQKVSDELH